MPAGVDGEIANAICGFPYADLADTVLGEIGSRRCFAQVPLARNFATAPGGGANHAK